MAGAPKFGLEIHVNTTTTYAQHEPVVTKLSDCRFVGVWSDQSESGPGVLALKTVTPRYGRSPLFIYGYRPVELHDQIFCPEERGKKPLVNAVTSGLPQLIAWPWETLS